MEGRKDVGVAIRRKHKVSCSDGHVLYLDCRRVHLLVTGHVSGTGVKTQLGTPSHHI